MGPVWSIAGLERSGEAQSVRGEGTSCGFEGCGGCCWKVVRKISVWLPHRAAAVHEGTAVGFDASGGKSLRADRWLLRGVV